MFLSRRLLLPAVSGLALLTGAGLPALASPVAAATQPAQTAGIPWAHDNSDLKPDERIRYGRLENGMRYALMRNATPPGTASLRLHINAGSLHENDDQQGLAHFTEHMLFNGTQNIPENEMLRILERLGLAFGADTNAATSFDQTYYVLELPRADDKTVDASLNIMREQVSRALMLPEDINAERDVIVGEARTRNTPAYRSQTAQIALLAPGQKIANRMPIGDLDIIRTAPAERFTEFYNAYYRPERASFIAVGDFDVDYMEAKVRAAFADWHNPYPDGPQPDLGTVQPRDVQAAVVIEPGTQSSVSLYWVRPYLARPDTAAKRRDDTLTGLAFAVLNRRLGEIARGDNPPFIGASAGSGDLLKSLDYGTIYAAFNPGGLPRALETIEQEQRRFVQYGVTAAELQREITNARTALENAVNAANTQQTAALAGRILSNINADVVTSSPADRLARFNADVADLDLEEINTLIVDALKGYGPVALVTTPVAIDGGEDAVVSLLKSSQQTPVAARQQQAALTWPYTDFGTPTQPISRQTFSAVDATMLTFPNNVRLIVKPTDYREQQILVSVATGLGDMALPKDSFSPLSLASSVFTAGGLGQLNYDDINLVLTGRTYGAGLSVEREAMTLTGATRPQDLELQLQVLAAYFTDPGLRPAPLEQLKGYYPQILEQSRATVAGALSLDGTAVLTGNDRRDTTPSVEDVQSVTAQALKAEVQKALADGPIDITIVGDVTLEAATEAVSKTFGALPTRSALPQPLAGANVRAMPAGRTEPYRFQHTGQPEQSGVVVYWPTTDAMDDRREARLVSLLSEVLSLRVLEEIREKQALTYSPSVSATASSVFPDYGYLSISGQVDTTKVADFHAAVDKVVASFAETPVTADELNRARAPMIERHRRSKAANPFWLGNLSDLARNPQNEPLVVNYIETLESFTPQDVQSAATRYLGKNKSWSFEVLPATAP